MSATAAGNLITNLPGTIPGMVNGIDLSSANTVESYQAIYDGGFRFAYVQSSRYSSQKDTAFYRHVQGLLVAGLTVGAYHFCSHDTDPKAQAKHFFESSRLVRELEIHLPPMVDFEYCTARRYINHPQHCVDWIETFSQEVADLFNDTPVIYTYPDYARRHQPALGASNLNRFDLCLASYTPGVQLRPDKIPAHVIPKPWISATLVQHKGNDGRVPGVAGACDMQVYTGVQAFYENWIGIKRPPSLEIYDVK